MRVLAVGGTIAMQGDRAAAPALDGPALVAAVPALGRVSGLQVQTLASVPGVGLGLAEALRVARAASAAADGRGVVVTSGTDTIEELAVLCDVVHAGDDPIVVTGAIRPASAPGADGPANLIDAVAAAGAAEAAGLGAVVVFAGEIHAARAVRKVDSVGPRAFGSPLGGPIGHVREGRVSVSARPARRPALAPARLDFRVPVVPAVLGDDGSLVCAALGAGVDGMVVVALGAGHVPVGFLDAVRAAAAQVPVVATVRPERGAMLAATYGFPGSERDLRASGVIPAPALSPAAARVTLLATLGAGLTDAGRREAFAPDDR